MSAERKVADAVILERAANVLERRTAFDILTHWVVRKLLLGFAWRLRNEADREWQRRG